MKPGNWFSPRDSLFFKMGRIFNPETSHSYHCKARNTYFIRAHIASTSLRRPAMADQKEFTIKLCGQNECSYFNH